MRVLAGDVGGTNARLALVELDGGPRIVAEQSARSQEIPAVVPFIAEFLAKHGARTTHACLGMAGPVVDGMVTGTNLPWQLTAGALGEALGIPHFRLINDFEAAAHGIPRLGPHQLLTLQEGQVDPHGSIALIGAGTGLGEGFLVRSGAGYRVQPSEGGHASYAPENARGWALWSYLAARHGHVSWERVVSGPGLLDCFEFVAMNRETERQAPLRAAMAREDPAAVLTRYALAGEDPLALEALDLFVDAYGAQAGNFALTVLSTGGVYVAGGIARQIAPLARRPRGGTWNASEILAGLAQRRWDRRKWDSENGGLRKRLVQRHCGRDATKKCPVLSRRSNH